MQYTERYLMNVLVSEIMVVRKGAFIHVLPLCSLAKPDQAGRR
jgi:hypothetical protein